MPLQKEQLTEGLLQRLIISLIEEDDFSDELKLELLDAMGGTSACSP